MANILTKNVTIASIPVTGASTNSGERQKKI